MTAPFSFHAHRIEGGRLVTPMTQRLVGMAAVLSALASVSVAFAGELVVADGATVSMEYALTLPDKTKVESNVGQPPLVFTQGSGYLVPGLEKAINGMKAGQSKRVEVPAEQAYGAYNPDAQIKLPRSKVPPSVKVGDVLARQSDHKPLKVLEITEDTVIVDANHPLAGKDLIFDVKILKVEPASGKP
jgi:FKBP-type peptidyl-prolyl cis-trans isomerase 2